MWLDPVDLDGHISDPAAKRYTENKRSTKTHAKGWERIWAECCDVCLKTVPDGNYIRLAYGESKEIIGRQQSWMLQDRNSGHLDPELVLPIAKSKQRLRPGQTKKNQAKANAPGAKKGKSKRKNKQAAGTRTSRALSYLAHCHLLPHSQSPRHPQTKLPTLTVHRSPPRRT